MHTIMKPHEYSRLFVCNDTMIAQIIKYACEQELLPDGLPRALIISCACQINSNISDWTIEQFIEDVEEMTHMIHGSPYDKTYQDTPDS